MGILSMIGHAQDELIFSGSLEANGNFFIKDEKIGAANTPQYERQQYGADAWLNLNGFYKGFEVGLRFDVFNNSNLLNPQDSYTDQGIGRWYIRKTIQKLDISGGYLYDQIGSGIIFRAYEERPLLIDNALFGVRLNYQISDNWQLKAFTGKQKFYSDPLNNLFETYGSVLRGGSLEGYVQGPEGSNWSFSPGIGVVSKTLSDEQMDDLANALSSYTPDDFIDKAPFNTHAVSIYNTMAIGAFSWYIEAAYKTEDVLFDPFATQTLWTGETNEGKFVLEPGYVIYNSISGSIGKFSGDFEYKRTRYFNFRADPFLDLNAGMVNFLPPMMRLNTYRLTARYSPATQEFGEQAFQADLRFAVDRNLGFLLNFSHITNLDNRLLYREFFSEITWKKPRKWTLVGGLQLLHYDQEIFEGKAGVPPVQTITPYVDYLYKFDRYHALRVEVQYMQTEQDFGSWIFALAEYSIAPHWIFEISDMWNVKPFVDEAGKRKTDPLHYPTAGVVYSKGANRYALRFVKQVEGVVCSGGICRLEPAFSGVKFNVISQF